MVQSTSVALSILLQIHGFFVLWKGSSGIQVTEVVAPPILSVGGAGNLDCRWNLSSRYEELYSVKWYHGLDEIYRFTPSKRQQAIQVFKNKYLRVDEEHSRGGLVRVTDITWDAEGLFRCEVSAEAPAFFTDYGTINISVVALPQSHPRFVGVRKRYRVGDWIDVTCHSPESKPAASLSIYVNGRKPPRSWLGRQVTLPTKRGKTSSSRRLQFSLQPDLLGSDGTATVQCDASILGLNRWSSKVRIVAGGPYSESVRGGDPRGGASTIFESDKAVSSKGRLVLLLTLTFCKLL